MITRQKIVWLVLALAFIAPFAFSQTTDEEKEWAKRMDPRSRLEGDDLAAWDLLAEGLASIGTDREQAASIFKTNAEQFPESRYAEQAHDLAENLARMVKEDREWQEPENPAALPEAERIRYWIYHLRNVSCYQVSQPGMCYLLGENFQVSPEAPNAAIELRDMGDVVIPAMIDLLDDRRLTSSIGYWRNFSPSRTVLRYQDAATQILNELMPEAFYRRTNTSAYFSTEDPEIRNQVKTVIKNWFRDSHGMSNVEKKWLAVESDIGIYPTIRLLEELAGIPAQREKVIRKLREMPADRHPFQLPQISFALAKLGDRKYVRQVAEAYFTGKYDYAVDLPDDSAAGSNASDIAIKQILLFASEERELAVALQSYLDDEEIEDGKKRTVYWMLSSLIEGQFESLPEGFTKSDLPYLLLENYLDNLEIYSSEGVRQCDRAAMAIQEASGKAFGFAHDLPTEKRDEIIASIKAWMESLPQ